MGLFGLFGDANWVPAFGLDMYVPIQVGDQQNEQEIWMGGSMNDKALLELAAKAAGIEILGFGEVFWVPEGAELQRPWNPLTDDGDALRLAVKLRLELGFPKEYCVWSFGTNGVVCMEDPSNDPYAATRRAIVRAASEIGRGME